MHISIEEKGVTVDMTFYAKSILEDEEVMEMRSPSTKAMFIVKSDVTVLSEEE
jgi:hypothetical protein